MRGNADDDEDLVEDHDAEHGDEYADPETYEEDPSSSYADDPDDPDHGDDGVDGVDGVDAYDGGGGDDIAGANPDVFLDVPTLKVDEIDLDVEDLRAHVSLRAEVLDLLRLNVGADVSLGRVHLGISGVEAQAQLTVRLHHVAQIIDRVLTTLDRNPELLHELARGVGSAAQDVGLGARHAVGEVGTGAGRAVQEVGRGAGTAVQDVGEGAGTAVRDVGQGVGSVARDVGRGAGEAVQDVGGGAGRAVEDVGSGAGRAVEDVGRETGRTVGSAGEAVGDTVEGAAESVAGAAEPVADAAESATGVTKAAASRPARAPRTRRVRGEDGKLPPRSGRPRTARKPEDPP
ncbi:hypothetical protein SGM_1487 [Streptomyces griseoaurantiacus M045]|uniref:Uncharacterized protein n=1 Tax=Streptomyces griseoaurantiacus M045 TaxID=996637 RepID=F3NEC3_9ACTN|nr:hypothetical protein [Streptomyces griseoaurantiacus]EGG48192.1 hypothetical protein SGM_1487 [Streptomyces griseoaurantiacus M045]